MVHIVSLAEIGALVGDPARANMLEALMDRRALTAKELAARAGICTANRQRPSLQNDHRRPHYDGTAWPPSLSFAGLSPRSPACSKACSRSPQPRTSSMPGAPFAPARAMPPCAWPAVAMITWPVIWPLSVTDAMLGRGQIEFDGDGGSVTDAGKLFLEKFGIDIAAATQSKRVFCRPCLDWSERRFHLAGAVGAALLHRTLELNWVKRQDNTRALAITRAGQRGFPESLWHRTGHLTSAFDLPILGHIPSLASHLWHVLSPVGR